MASGAPSLAPEPNEPKPNSSDDVVFWELLSSHFITRRPKFLEGTCTIWEAISNGDFMVNRENIWDNQFATGKNGSMDASKKGLLGVE
jgi:hypothetical protein